MNVPAENLQTPRIHAITFKILCQWGATKTFYRTKNILLAQQLLGHMSIKNTVSLTHLVRARIPKAKDARKRISKNTRIHWKRFISIRLVLLTATDAESVGM